MCAQELNISGQLAGLNGAIEKLQRQATARARDQEDARLEQELRMQQLEERQSATEASLRQFEQHIDSVLDQQTAELDELRQAMRSMLSEVVSRIADQFDAVQSSLEEAIAGRAADRAEQFEAIDETRRWTEAQTTLFKQEISETIRTQYHAASTTAEQHAAALSTLTQRLALTDAAVGDHSVRLTGVEEAQGAAESREIKGSQLLQEALTLWQQGMEERLGSSASKFDEYKLYVVRLRKEIRQLQQENSLTQTALVEALTRELGGVGRGVALLQSDAAGLLGVMRQGGGADVPVAAHPLVK